MPSGPQFTFAASYDSTSKIISGVAGAVLLLPIVVTHSIVVATLSVLLLLITYAYSPRSYGIADRTILIHRLIGDVRIPLDGVREIRPATPADFAGIIRLFGNGGLFGYYGLFRTSKLGKSWWYLTNRKNALVIVTAQKTFLVSPDDVDGFLAAVRAIAPGVPPRAVAPYDAPEPSNTAAGLIARLVVMALAVAGIALCIFAATYAPGLPSYTLTPESLTVHDRFYPVTVDRTTVDVDGIRIVDIGTGAEWRPTARTNGFANQHYRAGWFRAANGQKARMYWADGKRLVLLPPKGSGTPVLLEVQDPVQFVDEVRREWSGGR